ncbi:MAG: hypothetical protein ABI596_06935 [Pyrinomonadaceae bacterium]
MAKWTTSLLLILTLGASVISGMPLHSNEEKCAMHGMSGMDCCSTAQGHGNETEVAAARVCCAVNCPQSGTSGPSGVQLPRGATVLAAVYPTLVQPPMPTPIPSLVSSWAHSPPPSSNPAYIRNLALLI